MRRWRASSRATAYAVWIVGGPGEKSLAAEIAGDSGARDLTGTDLRDAILALGAAWVAISNDSGLLHVAAALGTPSIGIFGPTSPWHWAPLNPLAAVIETKSELPCRPCHKPVCRLIIIAACATLPQTRSWPPPAARWQMPQQRGKCRHNAVFIESSA